VIGALYEILLQLASAIWLVGAFAVPAKISLDNICASWVQLGEIGERGAVERDSKGVPWQNWEAMQGEVA